MIARVIARYEALGETAPANALAAISVGPTNVWDAARYEIAERLYLRICAEEAGAAANERAIPTPAPAPLPSPNAPRDPASLRGAPDVLFAGFLNPSGPCGLAFAMSALRTEHGALSTVLRHGNMEAEQGLEVCDAESFLRPRDFFSATHTASQAHAWMAEVLGEPLGEHLSTRKIRRALLHAIAVQRLFDRHEPRVVVIPDERLFGARAVGLIAKERNIPVLSLPESLEQLLLRMPPWGRLVSNKMFVLCAAVRDHLALGGIDPASFGLSGEVYLDAALGYGRRAAPPRDRRTVMFVSQGLPANRELVPALRRVVAGLPNTDVIVRPHPKEAPAPDHSPRTQSPLDAIAACDVLVTHSSYMALEACLLGCPVVLFDLGPVPHLPLLVSVGAAVRATSEATLRQAVEWSLGAGKRAILEAQGRLRRDIERSSACSSLAAIVHGLAGGQAQPVP